MTNTFAPRADAAAAVYVNTDITFTLDDEEWQCWCTRAELSYDVDEQDVVPLCSAEVRKLLGTETWTLDVEYYQDWTETGISSFLHDHRGQTVTFELGPAQEDGRVAKGTCVVKGGPLGGTAGELATGAVAMSAFNVDIAAPPAGP
jgi:hypothetical protein